MTLSAPGLIFIWPFLSHPSNFSHGQALDFFVSANLRTICIQHHKCCHSLSFFRFQFCVGAHNGWWCQKARLLPAISYIINNIKRQISTDSCKLHPAAINGASRDFIKAFFDITFLQNTCIFVKLRQGSGKDWQGMAVKVKGLKALSLAKSLH